MGKSKEESEGDAGRPCLDAEVKIAGTMRACDSGFGEDVSKSLWVIKGSGGDEGFSCVRSAMKGRRGENVLERGGKSVGRCKKGREDSDMTTRTWLRARITPGGRRKNLPWRGANRASWVRLN